MGQSCTKVCYAEQHTNSGGRGVEGSRADSPDPVMYDLMRKSILATNQTGPSGSNGTGGGGSGSGGGSKKRPLFCGQQHLLYRNHSCSTRQAHHHLSPSITSSSSASPTGGNTGSSTLVLLPPPPNPTPMNNPACPTRLLIRRRSLRVVEEGGGTHIYAIRYPEDTTSAVVSEHAASFPASNKQEQCPPRRSGAKELNSKNSSSTATAHGNPGSSSTIANLVSTLPPIPLDGDVFTNAAMASIPRQPVLDWVTVSEEHSIYIGDLGLTSAQCDHIITTTEQVCRGQYAAYTYAKQTLGCREFPALAQSSFNPVHSIVHAILNRLEKNNSTLIPSTSPPKDSSSSSPRRNLQLDDREPHIVKYDVTKKERQKLDMHTDKSEWTFLIALSNGCGVDYEGGGTYFECLDATVHIQRGHALIFPGKLRHCGQKITSGLRFLLVGFLVDKAAAPATSATSASGTAAGNVNGNAGNGSMSSITMPTSNGSSITSGIMSSPSGRK